MEEQKLKNSLKNQILGITLWPLVALTIVISAVSASVLYNSMIAQVHSEMEKDANLVKLNYEISGTEIKLEELSNITDLDVSFFLDDVRVLTTLKDNNGNYAVGSKAATVVKSEVLSAGQAKFYDDVYVDKQKSYAYYMPLLTEDGKIYGMIGVCCSAKSVVDAALRRIWPIVLTCIIAAFVIGSIGSRFAAKLGVRIDKIDKFVGHLADGDFNLNMPVEIMNRDDEIKHLAQRGAKMAKSIQLLVDYDALTGLNNRRYGEKKLKELKESAKNTGINYCVCIGDIDFFKKVNDTYGHEMGDMVLKSVAQRLKTGMQGKGTVARWGGEEFLLIFDNMNLENSEDTLNVILDSVREIIIPNTDRNITMSFGVTFATDEESTDSILKRADDNLYFAKENGRNQVVAK